MGKLGRKPNRLPIVNYYEARTGLKRGKPVQPEKLPPGCRKGCFQSPFKMAPVRQVFGGSELPEPLP